MRSTILAVAMAVLASTLSLPSISEGASKNQAARAAAQARVAAQRQLARMQRQGGGGTAGYYWWQGPGYYQWNVWSYRGY